MCLFSFINIQNKKHIAKTVGVIFLLFLYFMILAVIDCGTNTFNLLIVEVKNTAYTKIFNTRHSVKLGEGTINKGFIDAVPFNRGIAALVDFKIHITKYNVEKTLAYATSAIRDAKNGLDFITKTKLDLDIDINIIDGNREAELIYLGNKVAANLKNEPALIMDIGGGSTEFIIANGQQIFWKQSFLCGDKNVCTAFFVPRYLRFCLKDLVSCPQTDRQTEYRKRQVLSRAATDNFPVITTAFGI